MCSSATFISPHSACWLRTPSASNATGKSFIDPRMSLSSPFLGAGHATFLTLAVCPASAKESIESTDAQDICQITQSSEPRAAEGGAISMVKITHCEVCEKVDKGGRGKVRPAPGG